jgi:hypothetical protein
MKTVTVTAQNGTLTIRNDKPSNYGGDVYYAESAKILYSIIRKGKAIDKRTIVQRSNNKRERAIDYTQRKANFDFNNI